MCKIIVTGLLSAAGWLAALVLHDPLLAGVLFAAAFLLALIPRSPRRNRP